MLNQLRRSTNQLVNMGHNKSPSCRNLVESQPAGEKGCTPGVFDALCTALREWPGWSVAITYHDHDGCTCTLLAPQLPSRKGPCFPWPFQAVKSQVEFHEIFVGNSRMLESTCQDPCVWFQNQALRTRPLPSTVAMYPDSGSGYDPARHGLVGR